jgi:hypothetical protein
LGHMSCLDSVQSNIIKRDYHVVQSVLTMDLHNALSMASFVHVVMIPGDAFMHCLNPTSFLESVL